MASRLDLVLLPSVGVRKTFCTRPLKKGLVPDILHQPFTFVFRKAEDSHNRNLTDGEREV